MATQPIEKPTALYKIVEDAAAEKSKSPPPMRANFYTEEDEEPAMPVEKWNEKKI